MNNRTMDYSGESGGSGLGGGGGANLGGGGGSNMTVDAISPPELSSVQLNFILVGSVYSGRFACEYN